MPHCWARSRGEHTQADEAGTGGVGRWRGEGLRQHNGRQERAGEAEVRSQGGAAGSGRCVKVIKTFHDIRVCEVPRADH